VNAGFALEVAEHQIHGLPASFRGQQTSQTRKYAGVDAIDGFGEPCFAGICHTGRGAPSRPIMRSAGFHESIETGAIKGVKPRGLLTFSG
jgi:hypothetical protein